ncbi:hypothetical protein Tco_0486454 [Tanacetum coccineum]
MRKNRKRGRWRANIERKMEQKEKINRDEHWRRHGREDGRIERMRRGKGETKDRRKGKVNEEGESRKNEQKRKERELSRVRDERRERKEKEGRVTLEGKHGRANKPGEDRGGGMERERAERRRGKRSGDKRIKTRDKEESKGKTIMEKGNKYRSGRGEGTIKRRKWSQRELGGYWRRGNDAEKGREKKNETKEKKMEYQGVKLGTGKYEEPKKK